MDSLKKAIIDALKDTENALNQAEEHKFKGDNDAFWEGIQSQAKISRVMINRILEEYKKLNKE